MHFEPLLTYLPISSVIYPLFIHLAIKESRVYIHSVLIVSYSGHCSRLRIVDD